MQTVACAPTRAVLRTANRRNATRRANVVVRAEGKEASAAAPEKPKWTEPKLDPNTPSPIFGGSTGGLLRKAQVSERVASNEKKEGRRKREPRTRAPDVHGKRHQEPKRKTGNGPAGSTGKEKLAAGRRRHLHRWTDGRPKADALDRDRVTPRSAERMPALGRLRLQLSSPSCPISGP